MKRSPIRRRSARKAATDAAYAEARAAVEFRAYGRCEANTPACPPREHRGDHCHHILRRSHTSAHDPALLLLVCALAHEYIHAHPAEAYEKGWLLRGVS